MKGLWRLRTLYPEGESTKLLVFGTLLCPYQRRLTMKRTAALNQPLGLYPLAWQLFKDSMVITFGFLVVVFLCFL
jgi:hypothetical protein